MLTREELNQVKKSHNDAKTHAVNSPHKNKTLSFKQPEEINMDSNDAQDYESLKNKALAEWSASSSLRSEFSTKDRYVAFRIAELQGRVKILGGTVRGGA